MRDIERDVKDLLRSMGDEAGDLGDLPTSVRRRVVGRRTAVVVGGAAVFAAVLVGGASLASGLLSNDTSPANPRPAPDSRNDRAPQDLKGDLVATGTFDRARWWLSAYIGGDEELCTELATEDEDGTRGSGGGCGPFDADKHPIRFGVQSGGGASIASGHVPEDVERLELVLANNERVSVEFYEKPKGFPLPVKFYVIAPFFQHLAQELVAYDGSGAEVGRQKVFGLQNRPKIERIAASFVIDRGEHDGVPYVLRGRVDEQQLNEGGTWIYPCTTIMLGQNGALGGGGSCHIPVARNNSLSFSQSAFEGGSTAVVHGGTSEEIDRVTVELRSGEVFEAEMFEVDDTEFRFFLVFPDVDPEDLVGQVVAYSGAEELDRVDLCDPAMTSGGSACGP